MRGSHTVILHAASARELFETDLIGDLQTSASIVDQLALSEALSDTRDTRAMDPKYPSHMLVRDPEPVTSAPSI